MNAITAIPASSVIKWCVGLTAKTDTEMVLASTTTMVAGFQRSRVDSYSTRGIAIGNRMRSSSRQRVEYSN